MRSLSSAQPFRTITISSSATTLCTPALLHYARRRLGSRRSKRASFKRADFKPRPRSSCAIFNTMTTWAASTPMPQSGRSIASARRDTDTLWRIPGSADFPPVKPPKFPVNLLREFSSSVWFRRLFRGFLAQRADNRENSRFNGNVTGAARSSSIVGGGMLPMTLIAARRSIDRLGQLGGAEGGGFALRGGVGVERRALARLAAQ
jgi:hypothetical protein